MGVFLISSVFFFSRKINDSTGSAGSGGLVFPKPQYIFALLQNFMIPIQRISVPSA